MSQKERIAGVFGRAAEAYDQVGPRPFAHVGRRLVELAEIGPNDDVLDVATGRGAVLFPAAERARRVVGIDLAGPMVEALSSEISARALTNATTRVMDAEALDFPDGSFDAVLCSLSIFFLDVDRATAESKRVLRSRGRFGFTTFGKGDPRWDWHRELLASLVDDKGSAKPQTAAPKLETAHELQRLVGDVGFESVRVYEETHDLCFADPDEWWQWVWSQGQRGFLESLDNDRLRHYRAKAYAQLPNPIVNTWTILFAVARLPE